VNWAIELLRFALFIFLLLLLARVVLALVLSFARDWQPKGASLLATESVFTITDPPIKALRKVIPPISFGQVRLDIAFMVLFFGVWLLWQVSAFWG